MLRGDASTTGDTGRVSPRVSVVVPVFNGMPYLRDLADALIKQDYPDLEIVFSETGSTDGSAEFLATLDDPRIRIITPDAPGAARNWTAATEAAQGDFIKLVCQDDLIVAGAISRQVQDLEPHPTAVMAFAPRDIIDARGSVAARAFDQDFTTAPTSSAAATSRAATSSASRSPCSSGVSRCWPRCRGTTPIRSCSM